MAGPIRIAILANGSQARRELAGVANQGSLLGRALDRVGGTLVAGFAIDRLIRGTAALVTTGGAYVETLAKIQAITGANQTAIDRAAGTLEKQSALYAKMGETVQDASDGTLELAKSGLSLNDSLKAVYPTMVLAKSGQLEVADASALVANTLNTFNLKAADAGDIANDLANAADISSANVTDLAESFKFVAPLAAASHVSLAQTNAILAELANSGVKASNAGTGFRKFLASLQAPTGLAAKAIAGLNVDIFDAQGKMRPLPALIDDLQGSLSKLTEEDQAKKLRAIFGLTGITSAQIILKNGSEGLATYVKGVNRAGGAARLANASSQGLAGTLRTLRARAISGADALYRKYSPAVDSALQKVIADAQQHLPGAIDALQSAGHKLEPVLSSLITLAGDVGQEFGDLATGSLGHLFLNSLKLVLGITKATADALDAIPGPLREVAVAVGIGALAFPRLAAGITSTIAPLAVSATELKLWTAAAINAETRSTAFGIAALKMGAFAKQAAGPAGLGLLIVGAQHSDSALGRLSLAAGGAAAGFSVGGPWGAVIGGIAGGVVPALHDLVSGSDEAGGSMERAKPKARDFAATLDQVTAASTGATRALALQSLQERGALEQGTTLGLTQRTLIDATLGRKDAVKQVQAAITQYSNAEVLATGTSEAYQASLGGFRPVYDKNSQAIQKQARAAAGLANSIGVLTPQLRDQARETRTNAIATASLTDLFPKLKKGAISRIRVLGTEASVADVLKLQHRLKLQPKDLKTLLRVTGAVDSERAAGRVIARLKDVDKVKVAGPDIAGPVGRAANKGKAAADRGGRDLVDVLERHLAKTKANMPQLSPSVRSATGAAANVGRTGAAGIGNSVKTGFGAGFAGAVLSWSAQVRGAVAAAIAAGRAEARAHSPSEATRELGHDLADGLALGINERTSKTKSALAKLIGQLLSAGGSDQISSALEALTKFVEKHVNLKDDKAEKARERAILEHLSKQYKALRAIGKQQDALKDGNYLKYLQKGTALYDAMTLAGVKNLGEAREHLQALKDTAAAYAATIRSSFVDFGNITQLGLEHVTTGGILSALRARANQAEQYAALIDQLRTAGLNQTALQQLLDAGPEQGLATAQAIANGGAAAVTEINQLTTRLDLAGTQLGQVMSASLYAAGIAGAQGLVAGLEAQETALDKVARKLAHQLVKAMKDELGIKSPSRVMRDLMGDVQRGLAIGVDDVYVHAQGARIAKAVVSGFGTPALDAFMTGLGGRTPIALNVRVTSEGLHQLQRGRDVQADLDAWAGVGGITTVTVSGGS